MYLIYDQETPLRNAYISAQRTQNTILECWPTKHVGYNWDQTTTADDIVMADFYFWAKNLGGFIQRELISECHGIVYDVLGLSLEGLLQDSPDIVNVEYAYVYWKGVELNRRDLLSTELDDYLLNRKQIGTEKKLLLRYKKQYIVALNGTSDLLLGKFKVPEYEADVAVVQAELNSIATDALTKVDNGFEALSIIHNTDVEALVYDTAYDKVAFAALCDTNNAEFTTASKVISKVATVAATDLTTHTETYTADVVIEFTYTANDVEDSTFRDYLLSVLNDKNIVFTNNSFTKQMHNCLGEYLVTNDGLVLSLTQTDTSLDLGKDSAVDKTISESFVLKGRKATETAIATGLYALNPYEFIEFMGNNLDTQTIMPEASTWEKLIGIVLIIIAVAIAVVSAGSASGVSAAITSGATVTTVMAANFLFVFTLIISLESLALGVLASYLAKKGDITMAMVIGDSLVILQGIATMAGILQLGLSISSYIGMATTALKEGASTLVSMSLKEVAVKAYEAAKEKFLELVDSIWETLVDAFNWSSETMLQSLNKVMGWLNAAFKQYVKSITPSDADGGFPPVENEDSSAAVIRVDNLRLMQMSFDTYSFIDMNGQMEAMPYNMTEGTIRACTSKYYDAW